jgi:hypothetical protein
MLYRQSNPGFFVLFFNFFYINLVTISIKKFFLFIVLFSTSWSPLCVHKLLLAYVSLTFAQGRAGVIKFLHF